MKRKALIIYCDNTESGKLKGPYHDNQNYRNYLQSNLGGNWYSHEILSLNNPSSNQVKNVIDGQLNDCDYTFVIFSGHGFINIADNNIQYIELADKDVSVRNLICNSSRQSIVIDACRGFYHYTESEIVKGLSGIEERLFSGDSTRDLFNAAILRAEEGLTVLYSSSENQTSMDTDKGGAYLLSILEAAKEWSKSDKENSILHINEAHNFGKRIINNKFLTKQIPSMNLEKRRIFYPFAAKLVYLYG